MLDKTIPYHSIILAITPETIDALRVPVLPAGYSYHFYTPGDEQAWVDIELSVNEFSNRENGNAYFKQRFLAYPDELPKRCLFIKAADGQLVATSTAWFERDTDQWGPRPILHWVGCDPLHQGIGLGRAVVSKALSLFPSLWSSRQDVLLHTQTWSHRAVRLYHKLGFNICRKRRTVTYPNDIPTLHKNGYAQAIEVLKEVMSREEVEELIATAVD